jgi:hypothetical protein
VRYTGCRSVKDYLLREIYRRGEIVSITGLAIRWGVERCHLWNVAKQLEREGSITIDRHANNGPLILRPKLNYERWNSNVFPIQLGLWPKG